MRHSIVLADDFTALQMQQKISNQTQSELKKKKMRCFSAVEKNNLQRLFPAQHNRPFLSSACAESLPRPAHAIPPLSYFSFSPMFLFILTLVTFEPLNISVLSRSHILYIPLCLASCLSGPLFPTIWQTCLLNEGRVDAAGLATLPRNCPLTWCLLACWPLKYFQTFSDERKKKKTPRVIPRAGHDSSEFFQKVRNLIRKKTQK